jgi:hypothetical protein
MKLNFLKFGFYAVIFSMAIFVTSCESGENDHGQHQHNHEQHEHEQGEQHQQGEEESSVDQLGKEFTLAYVCPMHCEGSGSDKEGTCPTCKMTYIANADHDGH